MMVLELTAKVEALKTELDIARRSGAGASELLALQNKLCNAIDLVVLCMSEIVDALEVKMIGQGGNS